MQALENIITTLNRAIGISPHDGHPATLPSEALGTPNTPTSTDSDTSTVAVMGDRVVGYLSVPGEMQTGRRAKELDLSSLSVSKSVSKRV